MVLETSIEIIGVNGERCHIAGKESGVEGIHLMADISGLVDPVAEAVTKSPASRPGTRFISSRFVERTLVFRVGIENDGGYYDRDDFWRRLWSFDAYTKIKVTAARGYQSRTLYARLEEIEVDTEYDPGVNELTEVTMTVVADDPFYYQDPLKFTVPAVTGASASFSLPGVNESPMPVYPRLALDFKAIEDPESEIIMTLDGQEFILPAPKKSAFQWVVNLDPGSRQIVDTKGDPAWQRMNGRRINFPVAPSKQLSKAEFRQRSGKKFTASISLEMKVPFQRPWGSV